MVSFVRCCALTLSLMFVREVIMKDVNHTTITQTCSHQFSIVESQLILELVCLNVCDFQNVSSRAMDFYRREQW